MASRGPVKYCTSDELGLGQIIEGRRTICSNPLQALCPYELNKPFKEYTLKAGTSSAAYCGSFRTRGTSHGTMMRQMVARTDARDKNLLDFRKAHNTVPRTAH